MLYYESHDFKSYEAHEKLCDPTSGLSHPELQ